MADRFLNTLHFFTRSPTYIAWNYSDVHIMYVVSNVPYICTHLSPTLQFLTWAPQLLLNMLVSMGSRTPSSLLLDRCDCHVRKDGFHGFGIGIAIKTRMRTLKPRGSRRRLKRNSTGPMWGLKHLGETRSFYGEKNPILVTIIIGGPSCIDIKDFGRDLSRFPRTHLQKGQLFQRYIWMNFLQHSKLKQVIFAKPPIRRKLENWVTTVICISYLYFIHICIII